MSLRIAFISSSFPDEKSKAGVFAGALTQSLAELNHEVHVITSARLEIRNTFSRVTMHKVMDKWRLVEIPRFLQTLMIIRPQIIHLNHPESLFLNLYPEMNKVMGGVKVVVTLHDFVGLSWFGKKKLLVALGGSDFITVPDEKNKKTLMRKLSKNMHDKIEILEDGFDKAANQMSRIYSRLV